MFSIQEQIDAVRSCADDSLSHCLHEASESLKEFQRIEAALIKANETSVYWINECAKRDKKISELHDAIRLLRDSVIELKTLTQKQSSLLDQYKNIH